MYDSLPLAFIMNILYMCNLRTNCKVQVQTAQACRRHVYGFTKYKLIII